MIRTRPPVSIGDKFNHLTVCGEPFFEVRENSRNRWMVPCKCCCDTELDVAYSNLIGDKRKSCGCKNQELWESYLKHPDLHIGDKFHYLTIIGEPYRKERKNGSRGWYVKTRCKCDTVKGINCYSIITGKTKSCGCYAIEQSHLGEHQWDSYEEIPGRMWQTINARVIERNLPFSITMESIWNLFIQQGRKCALSGIELDFSPPTASLDQIVMDTSKGMYNGYIKK